MNDLEDRLDRLSDVTMAPSPPLDRVARRAGELRRRRRIVEAVAIASFAVIAAVAGPSILQWRPPGGEPDVVFEQPPAPLPDGWKRTTIGALTIDHPRGWQPLHIAGEDTPEPNVVLSNRRLSGADLELALLAHADVQFSKRFPRDAVVFVVGGDWMSGPSGPAGDLGPPRVTAPSAGFTGRIRARTGTVAQSILRLAAYVGPEAPDGALGTVGAVARRLQLRPLPPSPGEEPPPPADSGPLGGSGNDADNPIFTDPWPVKTTFQLDDDEVIRVRTKGDCAAVTLENRVETRNLSVQHQRCGLGTSTAPLELFVSGRISPGTVRRLEDSDRHLIVARLFREVEEVEGDLVGRGTVRVSISDGWAIVVAKGRILRLIGYDETGKRLGQLVDG